MVAPNRMLRTIFMLPKVIKLKISVLELDSQSSPLHIIEKALLLIQLNLYTTTLHKPIFSLICPAYFPCPEITLQIIKFE